MVAFADAVLIFFAGVAWRELMNFVWQVVLAVQEIRKKGGKL